MNSSGSELGAEDLDSEGLPRGWISLALPLFLTVPILYYSSNTLRKSRVLRRWNRNIDDIKTLVPYLRVRDQSEARSTFGLLAAVLFCVALGRFINVVSPLLYRRGIDQLSAPAGTDRHFPLVEIVGYLVLRYMLVNFLSFGQWAVTRRLENLIVDRITVSAYDKMMSLSADYHDSKDSREAWSTIRESGRAVSSFMSDVCFQVFPNALDLVFGAIAFGSVCGPYLAGIMLLVLAAYVVVLIKVPEASSKLNGEWDEATRARNRLSGEAISNWWTVYLFGRLEFEKFRHARAVDRQRRIDRQYCEGDWVSFNAKHSVTSFGVLILSLLVSRDIWHGQRRGGDLVMFLHVWNDLIGPVQDVLKWNGRMSSFSRESKRLLEILHQEPTVRDKEGAKLFEYKTGSIRFEGVTFSYSNSSSSSGSSHDSTGEGSNDSDNGDGDSKSDTASEAKETEKNPNTPQEASEETSPNAQPPALQNISFTAHGGQTIGIVGKSGGGKSTLLKLLTRSYDPTSGCITIDGQDIRSVRRDTLISHVGVVPQNIGVFNASVLENLQYGRADASLEECQEACRAVGLHERIVSLGASSSSASPSSNEEEDEAESAPNQKQKNKEKSGYDSPIGESGSKLSGGELQRLALARVLLRNPPIVLLDEATSNLDAETEAGIQEYLKKWSKGKTVVVVAHRLASVARADLILAVKDGRVVEQGSLEELLAKKGYFWGLWERQRLG